jgi:hypothetical protein
MDLIRTHILRTLLYFEIFRHALTTDELLRLLGIIPEQNEYDRALASLIDSGWIRSESGYLFLSNGSTSTGERIGKQERALRHQKVARRVSRVIGWHPFVRGVFISGSLSKKALSKKDDIDFFVITEPGRLWLCRTFLTVFKKVFLLNSKKYFCINYYIDSDSLEIPDRNLFTATELVFLQPMRNPVLAEQFFSSNQWIRFYYPREVYRTVSCAPLENPWPKNTVEWCLKGRVGTWLDNRFMRIFLRRAEQKFSRQNPEQFSLNFRCKKNVSKHHPEGFQNRILQTFASKVSAFEREHGVDLSVIS